MVIEVIQKNPQNNHKEEDFIYGNPKNIMCNFTPKYYM
jgi:hypothetical protein